MGDKPSHHGDPWLSNLSSVWRAREREKEREPYWRDVCCRCNLCWCSLVQQCETTLRQRCDVWACCSASLNLTPTAAVQLELMGQRTGPQMVLWPHHPYTSHCWWLYKWISTILPSQKGEYLDFCMSVVTLYICSESRIYKAVKLNSVRIQPSATAQLSAIKCLDVILYNYPSVQCTGSRASNNDKEIAPSSGRIWW